MRRLAEGSGTKVGDYTVTDTRVTVSLRSRLINNRFVIFPVIRFFLTSFPMLLTKIIYYDLLDSSDSLLILQTRELYKQMLKCKKKDLNISKLVRFFC